MAPDLPAEGPIGEELAIEIVQWVKRLAPPVLNEIRAWLASQTSAPVELFSWSARRIAQIQMAPDMKAIPIGGGYAGSGGTGAIVTISLMRDGTLVWKKVRYAR
jgi:hypothetical protein